MPKSSFGILVVDDDPLVCEVMRDMLKEIGYQVSLASNGAEARPLLSSEGIHLLITDQLMLGERGQHLADYAQSLGIPALLISGDADSIEELEAGQHAFLRKPFRLSELEEKIDKVLSLTKPRRLDFSAEMATKGGMQ
jgi:two-component system OmpR family response regulator